MFRRAGALLSGSAAAAGAFTLNAACSAQEASPAFSPKEFRKFPLMHRRNLTHDTQQLTFALNTSADYSGLTCASCVVTKCKDPETGKNVIRPYTPTSAVDRQGQFDLIVKKYPNGKMGTHLHGLAVGESVEVKGPFKKLDIQPGQYKKIAMVAGGTGITPMYQVITYLLAQPDDKTELTLVYANRTPEDIILKTELDTLERVHPRFNVYHTVSEAGPVWEGGLGFINESVLKAYLPKPGDGKVLVCGPPGLMKHISGDKDYEKQPPAQGEVSGLLKEQGYTNEDVFKF